MTLKLNPFSHIDLYVTSFEKALPFYEKLLPQLGFTNRYDSPSWKVFATQGEFPSTAYFAITEDKAHQLTKNLVGFWAQNQEEVNHIAALVEAAGGRITAGPGLFPVSPTYYSVYFEDPCGNRYEFLHRMS